MNTLNDLREAIAAHDMGRIRTLLTNWTPPMIVAMIKPLTGVEQAVVIRVLPRKIAAATFEMCTIIAEDLAAALKEIQTLGANLDGKLGDSSPSLAEISRALSDCQALTQEMLSRKRPAPVAQTAAETGAAAGAASAAQPAGSSQRANTRDEVYARLAEAADQLLQMEPHSPVAYMIQRAVKLGHLSLPELIKVLVRDPAVLTELNRDLDLGYEQRES